MALLPARSLVRKARYVAFGSVREFERTGGRSRLSLLERIQKSQGEPGVPAPAPKRPVQSNQPPAPAPAPLAPRTPPQQPPFRPAPGAPVARPLPPAPPRPVPPAPPPP